MSVKRRTAPAIVNHLVAFEAAARLGSFRAAAEELFVTPGAVAQQVRNLEEKLGMALFERLPRGLKTTDNGNDYVQRVRLALDVIEDATVELLERGDPADSEHVLISTTPAFASRWLIPRLGHLAAAHPGLSLMIDASDSTRPLNGKGSVDLAVRWGTPPFAEGHARPFLPGQAVPVCSPQFRQGKHWQRPTDLSDAALISDSHNNWKRWFDHYGAPGTRFNGPSFSQTILAIEAAERGMGVALVPRLLVSNALESGSLVLALDEDFHLQGDAAFFLVTREKRPTRNAVSRVVYWLYEETRT
ncbi:MAG TPA: LysR substrate-binding domain-containing protein [Pseudomonas sp.]|uniref:LysR substrate-binding domain-containing protein n=1 Tax=Pseudomonas sp. TaxID=306 RepID=UPI002B4A8086|nr:LysR substrate-binding domain-containing protein [Pseudomonas sp.]HKS12191.1 LysR substrate-binding domain-containing protein [Pseudomonas sp.]